MSTASLSSPEVDNERDGPTVGAMSSAWLSSPEVDYEWDGPTVGAMSTASLSSPEVDNERDGPTVVAMSTAWLSSPEVDNERDGPTVGAMSTASLSSPEVDNERGNCLSDVNRMDVLGCRHVCICKRPHTRHSEASNDISWRCCLCRCGARKLCHLIDSFQLSDNSHHPP